MAGTSVVPEANSLVDSSITPICVVYPLDFLGHGMTAETLGPHARFAGGERRQTHVLARCLES